MIHKTHSITVFTARLKETFLEVQAGPKYFGNTLISTNSKMHVIKWTASEGGGNSCITSVGMFKELITSEDGLMFSRYLYSMNIADPVKKERFLKKQF